jgi:Major Facilitator Superfamily
MPRLTRARYWVVVFAVTLAFITYIDRACIGQTAPAIRKELGLTPLQMGYVFSAFALAYALFEIPSGWLGDWIGCRRLLMIWRGHTSAVTVRDHDGVSAHSRFHPSQQQVVRSAAPRKQQDTRHVQPRRLALSSQETAAAQAKHRESASMEKIAPPEPVAELDGAVGIETKH